MNDKIRKLLEKAQVLMTGWEMYSDERGMICDYIVEALALIDKPPMNEPEIKELLEYVISVSESVHPADTLQRKIKLMVKHARKALALIKAESQPANKPKIDSCILAFAERMQYKLDKNKHKECSTMNPDGKGRGWSHCTIPWLINRIRQETDELEDAFYTPKDHKKNAMGESADVGNFAMVVFDILSSEVTGKEPVCEHSFSNPPLGCYGTCSKCGKDEHTVAMENYKEPEGSETRIEHQSRLKEEAYRREKALNIENRQLQTQLEDLTESFNHVQDKKVAAEKKIKALDWIPVSERLPDYKLKVWLCNTHYPDSHFTVGHLFNSTSLPSGTNKDEWLISPYNVSHLTCYTHWMPIPTLPEEKKDG